MTSSFETLPPELFRFILTYLSPEDTSALSQTCHRMNMITRDENIWRQYFIKRYYINRKILLNKLFLSGIHILLVYLNIPMKNIYLVLL